MSRGPGRIQRQILELIAANPNGAWKISDLCRVVYGRGPVTKAQRVAVGRALQRMRLPGTWELAAPYFSGGLPLWLVDRCNLAGVRVMHPGADPLHFQPKTGDRLKHIPTIYEFVQQKIAERDARKASA